MTKSVVEKNFKFIDLFAGIGGIRLAFQAAGGECVFSSEIDKFAQATYAANHGAPPAGDITKIEACEIPDHDVLLGGFPCQAFSTAGLRKGFNDTRGTMFFEIQRIIEEKKPRALMLENVKGLISHDSGKTLQTILCILDGMGYQVFYKVLGSHLFGLPQKRERIFIVGFDRSQFAGADFSELFQFPDPPCTRVKLGDILEVQQDKTAPFTLSDKAWASMQERKERNRAAGKGFGFSLFNDESPYTNTISARYYKDGSEILIDQSHAGKNPRKLTPREAARLQGFPESFDVGAVSNSQMYKQLGNSVAVPVVEAVARQMIKAMNAAQ